MLNIKKITAGIVTAMLLTGMLGTTAMATEPAPTPGEQTKKPFTITKNLIMDENVTKFPAFKFTFDVEAINTSAERDAIMDYFNGSTFEQGSTEITGESKTNTLKELIVIDDAANGVKVPEIADVTITYQGEEEGTTKDGLRTVTGTADLQLENITFPKAGLYLYKVTENHLSSDGSNGDWTPISDKDELIRQSSEEYIIMVSVVNGDNGPEISRDASYVLHKTEGDGYGKSSAVFENIYQRDSTPPPNGDPKYYDLKIQKTVTGQYGDKTKEFLFNITLAYNATEEMRDGEVKTKYTAQKYNADGTKDGEAFELNIGSNKDAFTLKDGQYILLLDFPVGSSYQLEESETDRAGYQTEVDYTVNGTVQQKVDHDVFAEKTITIGENENSANVTNNADLVLTGIVTDNLSFILLIVVAVAGMTAYVVLKRRLRNR